jgi:hypothetical protein
MSMPIFGCSISSHAKSVSQRQYNKVEFYIVKISYKYVLFISAVGVVGTMIQDYVKQ